MSKSGVDGAGSAPARAAGGAAPISITAVVTMARTAMERAVRRRAVVMFRLLIWGSSTGLTVATSRPAQLGPGQRRVGAVPAASSVLSAAPAGEKGRRPVACFDRLRAELTGER